MQHDFTNCETFEMSFNVIKLTKNFIFGCVLERPQVGIDNTFFRIALFHDMPQITGDEFKAKQGSILAF